MREFDYFRPKTVAEALALLAQYNSSAVVVAGGTDVVLDLNERKIKPEVIVDIKSLKELDYIIEGDGIVRVGAATTFATIESNKFICEKVKVLAVAASKVGSPQIRNLGTIGGNVVTASVAGDGLCAMVTLDASVKLRSAHDERVMKLTDFLDGEGTSKNNALKSDELLTEIFFSEPDKYTASSFYKLGKRKALSVSVIGGGMAVRVNDKGICTWVSMRGGCLARYPLQFKHAEEHLLGKRLTLKEMQVTLPMLHDAVYESAKNRPWSVFYKRESVQGVFNKLFVDILEQLGMEEKQ